VNGTDDERARMSEWFETVSYVESYEGELPEVDDPDDEQSEVGKSPVPDEDARLRQLTDAGCHPELVALIGELAPDTSWYAEPAGGQADWYHVKASVDSEGAVYIDRRHLMVALPPEDAGRIADRLSTRVERKNPTTWRVAISPDHTRDPRTRAIALDAVRRSIVRSVDRNRRDRGDGHLHDRPARPVCPVHFTELPINGACELCS
jgi:hypothetical protein